MQVCIFFLKHKSVVKAHIEKLIKSSERDSGGKIQIFRSDNGLEFVDKEVGNLFGKLGIKNQTSVKYTSEQSGRAERKMRTLVEAARSMTYKLSKKKL